MIKFGVGAVLRQPEPNLSNAAIGSGYCRTSHWYSNQNYFPLWPSFPLLAFIYNHCMSLGLSFLSPAICALHSAQVSLTPMMHLPDLWIMVPPTCWVFYIKDCCFFSFPFSLFSNQFWEMGFLNLVGWRFLPVTVTGSIFIFLLTIFPKRNCSVVRSFGKCMLYK